MQAAKPVAGRDGRCHKRLSNHGEKDTMIFMSEIIFEVREDEADGGYTASALGVGIHTEADTLDELRVNVREAVDCFYDDPKSAPQIIRLHFVRDEVLAR